MPDDFNKNTSIEDEIEKSLQKMVEEETTVAKAYVGNAGGNGDVPGRRRRGGASHSLNGCLIRSGAFHIGGSSLQTISR